MWAEVQMTISRSTRSGALAASHMPIIPPIDSPKIETRRRPNVSSVAATSVPSSAIEYGPSGAGEAPCPRMSTRTIGRSAESAAA